MGANQSSSPAPPSQPGDGPGTSNEASGSANPSGGIGMLTPNSIVAKFAYRRAKSAGQHSEHGGDSCSTGNTADSSPTTTMAGSQVLTTFQKKMLVQTWSHVHRAGSGGIGKVAYSKFLNKRSRCRVMFQKASAVHVFGQPSNSGGSLSEHQKLLSELLNDAVQNLSNLEQVGENCVEHGIRHSHMAKHGFDKELWDTFGQVLLESITQLDTVRKHKELMKAWTILISFIVDKLRQGYEMGIRRPSLQKQLDEEGAEKGETGEMGAEEDQGGASSRERLNGGSQQSAAESGNAFPTTSSH